MQDSYIQSLVVASYLLISYNSHVYWSILQGKMLMHSHDVPTVRHIEC